MIRGIKEYNMAVALLNFRQAYKTLVSCSKSLPDLDLTQGYPFFLLDFEEIEPAVLNWCSTQASELMGGLPDIVENPACLRCDYLGRGLGKDGQCKGHLDKRCGNFPQVMFSRALCTPALIEAGVYNDKLSDGEVHALYIQEVYNHGCPTQTTT